MIFVIFFFIFSSWLKWIWREILLVSMRCILELLCHWDRCCKTMQTLSGWYLVTFISLCGIMTLVIVRKDQHSSWHHDSKQKILLCLTITYWIYNLTCRNTKSSTKSHGFAIHTPTNTHFFEISHYLFPVLSMLLKAFLLFIPLWRRPHHGRPSCCVCWRGAWGELPDKDSESSCSLEKCLETPWSTYLL